MARQVHGKSATGPNLHVYTLRVERGLFEAFQEAAAEEHLSVSAALRRLMDREVRHAAEERAA